jgi:hypothetical protein
MRRRQFLSTSISAVGATLSASALAAVVPPADSSPEYYLLRRYQLTSGPQTKLAEDYFANALIPALNRLGITPVGAFALDVGEGTPAYYLLMPSTKLEALVRVDHELAKDSEFLQAAGAFWSAPAIAPPFVEVESSLMRAFEGRPKLTKPDLSKSKQRIFQLRTYRSPTDRDHIRKVEMFHSGEFEIFARSGCASVFYGDTLVGPRMPNLTYMLTFPDMAALTAGWDKFRNDPDWKKLTSDPKFSFEAIVSNISNLMLKPLACSQI